MNEFELTILGCGSARPSVRHLPSAQVLSYRGKLFMIDCGEGAQREFFRYGFNLNRVGHIFISHLHGDHCYGLIGFISTLILQGKTGELTIHAHNDLEKLLAPSLEYFCRSEVFKVIFSPLPVKGGIIYEDKSLQVTAFPLKHRVPSYGFRFDEKEKLPHIYKSAAEYYQIPLKELQAIKEGADYITPEGETIPNKKLVLPPSPSQSYAYCSDTIYTPRIVPFVKGVTVLYHESTYTEEYSEQAKDRYHSTAAQAADIARQAEVGTLILGHYSSRYKDEAQFLNEARPIFPNTLLSNEGMKFRF